MSVRTASALCALAALCGCVTLSRPTPPLQEYLLDYEPPPAVEHAHLPIVLRVAPLGIAAMYAGSGIVYREAEHGIGKYSYHRWAAEPAGMIGDLLARDLAASGLYDAVLRGPTLIRSDYELSGEVEELGQRASSGCIARVALRLLLRPSGPPRGGQQAVIFQRSYQGEEPCRSDKAEDLVAAMSRAMGSISAQVREDTYAAIAGLRAGGDTAR